MLRAQFVNMTDKATAEPALNSNKPLIKKLIGLIVVVAVCVTVIVVVVVKVVGSGSSDDDKKEKVKFAGKSNELKKKKANKQANFRTKYVSKSGGNFFVYFFFLTIFFLSLQSVY